LKMSPTGVCLEGGFRYAVAGVIVTPGFYIGTTSRAAGPV